jgi:hypothetical protein
MSDQGFWNTTMASIQTGASKFISNEIENFTNPVAKEVAQPDATKSVLDSMQAQLKSTHVLFLVIGLFVVAALLMGGRGRGR